MTISPTTIWLDQTYMRASEKSNSGIHLSLCKCDPYLVTFRDADKCVDYVRSLKDEANKIILIISNETSPSNILLRLSEELPLVGYVYIINSSHTGTFETASKTYGVYMDLESLCDHLRQLPTLRRRRRKRFVGDDFTLTILRHTYDPSISTASASERTSALPSDTDGKRQETEFMYALILRDILRKTESNKEEMVEFCRQKCADNQTSLNIIDEFEAYYDASNAIFWYTRDTFLFRLLNKELREQEFDSLYALRYFIKDLHYQIIEQHCSELLLAYTAAIMGDVHAAAPSISTVYRGQLMPTEEFNKKIRNSEGALFSASSFLSTTIHREVAMVYAGNRSRNEMSIEQSVLFQIEINKNYCDYANISKNSAFEGDEEEILFTMGSLFRVVSIHLSDDGFWDVKLRLTVAEDDELTRLTQHMRWKIICCCPLLSLGRLMLEIPNYDKAEQFHLLSLKELIIKKKHDIIPDVYNNLGFIYKTTGKLEKAIEYYEKSLETYLEHLSPTDSELAHVYNNLGAVFRQQCDYDKALSCYKKALEIALNSPIPDKNEIAIYYNSIGGIYQAQQRDSEALEMFEKCLECPEKQLPVNDPLSAVYYNNIAQVHHALSNYEKSIEYLKKTLEIQRGSFLPNHPDLATTYKNLGVSFHKQRKFKEAAEMYQKALEIQLKLHSSDHPDIATTYTNLSLVYRSQGRVKEALENIKLAYNIHSQHLHVDHPEIVADLWLIGCLEESLETASEGNT